MNLETLISGLKTMTPQSMKILFESPKVLE